MAAYDQADYLLIPLLDGSYGVAQIFETETLPEPWVYLLLSSRIAQKGDPITPFKRSDVIALVRVLDTPIRDGFWETAGFDQIPSLYGLIDHVAHKALGFPGAPLHDPAVIEAFVSAWHGHYPWAGFGDLFDQIKRPTLDRPAAAT